VTIDHEIEKNQRPTDPDLMFSLTCRQCDAGQHITCYEEAVLEGWMEIHEAEEDWRTSDMLGNYMGLCPDCRAEEELEQEQRRQKAQVQQTGSC